MFLGQRVSFTRSGNVIRGFNNAQVGAIHVSQTGYTSVTITGTGVNATFDLEDGYNLLVFPNASATSLTMAWQGTGTVDYSTLGVFTTDIALSVNHERPYSIDRFFAFPEDFQYSTATSISARIGFEWRYLGWDKVDTLEELFDRHGVLGDPRFVLIPDGFEGERYNVIITSPFDFYPSSPVNFANGASGAMVFESFD